MDDADDSTRPPKRRKIRIACQQCREKKTRCDGARPVCQACVRKKLGPENCVYLDPSSELSDTRYVQGLETRIRELEQVARGGFAVTAVDTAGSTSRLNNTLPPDHGRPSQPEPNRSSREIVLPRNEDNNMPRYSKGASPSAQMIESTPNTNDAHIVAAHLLGLNGYREQPSRVPDTFQDFRPRDDAPDATGTFPADDPQPQTPRSHPQLSHRQQHRVSEPPARSNNTSHFLSQDETGSYIPPTQGDPDNIEVDEDEQPSDAMGASEGTPINSNNSLFFGPSSAAAYMKSVQETLGTGGHGLHGAEDGVSSTVSRASHRRQMKLKRDMENLLDGLTLPTRRLADALLEVYWDSIHPFYPILHKPSFMRRYNEIWSQADSSRDELHYFDGNVQRLRAFHATLNIALALGCIRARSDASSLKSAKTYYDRSSQLLQEADMEQGSIQLVQALVLTAQYLQSTDMANRCWITIGNAIRIAQGIGVQLDRPSESQAEREERRRTWWCCILMDRVLSMTFGRPVMVVWRTVVPKPEPIDDESLSEKPGSSREPMTLQELSANAFFSQTLKLTDVLMLVLTNFYRPVEERRISTLSNDPISKLTLVVEVDNELARWRQQLPQHLIFQPSELSGETNPIYTRQAALLHFRYLHLRILLFRPITIDLSSGILLAATEPQRSTDFQHMVITGCVRSCVSAAQELVDLLHIQLHSDCAPRVGMRCSISSVPGPFCFRS
uniref:Zn(2)-C6 fungal-type domain-containing protein n=1 Tax=Bionectria ochroleuca TaxID=29856 RepID=A0A8H7K9X2_BIOOC